MIFNTYQQIMPYYSVHKGHQNGIFLSWNECQKNTSGFSGAIFKKFNNKKDAEYFLKFGKETEEDIPPKDLIVKVPKRKIVTKKKDKKVTTSSKITVYTDGACSNNGSSSAIAGIGVYFGEDDKRNVSRKVVGKQTNNVAELTAILEVSKILSKEIQSGVEVEICSDSVYSIRCCTSYGKKQDKLGWSNEIPNKELVKKIYNSYKDYSNVTFRHVKAHTDGSDIDSVGNANADRLANEAIGVKECPYSHSSKNIYLDVKFRNKDKIKALGGKWDKDEKKWYISNPKVEEDVYLFTDPEIKKIVDFFSSLYS